MASVHLGPGSPVLPGLDVLFLVFVKNFITLASPLCALTKKTQGRFILPTETQVAIEALKEKLTSASVFHMHDPEVQFIVEVDTSNMSYPNGQGLKGAAPVCIFLPPINCTRENDAGDHELLAIKLALEEWRH